MIGPGVCKRLAKPGRGFRALKKIDGRLVQPIGLELRIDRLGEIVLAIIDSI